MQFFFRTDSILIAKKKNSCKSSDVNHCGTGTFALLYVSAAAVQEKKYIKKLNWCDVKKFQHNFLLGFYC